MANTNTKSNILHYKNGNNFLFSFNSKTLLRSFSKCSFHFIRLTPPSPPPPPLLSLSFSPPQPPCSRIARVSTAPVEYAPPAPDSSNFHQEISRLLSLRSKLADCKTLNEKHAVLNAEARVKCFFNSGLARVLGALDLDLAEVFLLKCLVAAGQEHVLTLEGIAVTESNSVENVARSSMKSALYALVEMIERFDLIDNYGNDKDGFEKKNKKINGVALKEEELGDLKKLLKTLGEIEQFYDCIGGIIG